MQNKKFWSMSRVLPLLAALFLVGSCGREAPVYQPGNILVTSSPEGASIFLDGEDTGLVTPATLADLEPDSYIVTVVLDGYEVSPEGQTAVVSPLRTVELPTFALSRTTLAVTSTPAGAEIFIDGQTTNQFTPAVLVGLDPGMVEVSLSLENYLISPAAFSVDVQENQANAIPADTFMLRARHTVLFEGFSNVSCQGCPEMAINMEDVTHRPGYGSDRVLYIKYSMQWPSATDPHYLHNTAENNGRMNYYLNDVISGIPVLNMLGTKATGTSANNTPDADEIAALLEGGALAQNPGFLIDVSADFSVASVPVEVTITALDDVALAGKTLFVALVQTFISYAEAPGSEEETEFHNIFRDRADSVADLTDLTSGQTQTITTTVLKDLTWPQEDMLVVAFVQDDSDHTIYQAGSTALSAAKSAAFFTGSANHFNLTVEGE